MLAELFKAVFDRLDTRFVAKVETLKDSTGSVHTGYFKPNGEWQSIVKGLPDPKFPAVKVYSAKSLVDYSNSHASRAIDEARSVLTVNRTGLQLYIDYGAGEGAERKEQGVTFPAAFDEECEGAAAAIKGALGKWTSLEAFDGLLDKCAPFIGNFIQLEEAASNMEGHESAKLKKTATSFQVEVQGEVTCAVEIPKVMKIQLLFMGNPIQADVPLRLKVENKQVFFHLVDNGALAKAQMEVLRKIKTEVIAALPKLLVIDGTIGQ